MAAHGRNLVSYLVLLRGNHSFCCFVFQLSLGDDVDPTYMSLPFGTLTPQGCSTRCTEHTGQQPPHYRNSQSQLSSHPKPSRNSQSKYLFYEDKEDNVPKPTAPPPSHMAVVPIHQPCPKTVNLHFLPPSAPQPHRGLPHLHPLSPLSLSTVSLAVRPPAKKSAHLTKHEKKLAKKKKKEAKEKVLRATRFNRCYMVVLGLMVLLIFFFFFFFINFFIQAYKSNLESVLPLRTC